MQKKKVTWITPDYFVDTDIMAIPTCSQELDINWIVYKSSKIQRFGEKYYDSFTIAHPEVRITFVKAKYYWYNPLNFLDWWRLGKEVRHSQSDVVYSNIPASLPFFLFYWLQLPRKKLILTSHQGAVHDGFRFKRMSKIMRWIIYRRANIVNLFSKSQATIFKEFYKYPKVVLIPLGLKNFGDYSENRLTGADYPIRFLSFGIINYGKNIELLINAACKLYEKGYNNFKVSINGKCNNWEKYQELIKYPEIFELDIRMIENEKIPELFTRSHYFVQPYRIVTQSGPMKIAFFYNLPIIASNLPGFTDEMKEGYTGYLFEAENLDDLVRIMGEVIDNHKIEYDNLIRRMNSYVKSHYSDETIGRKYIEMFNLI